jgi:amino acid transporter
VHPTRRTPHVAIGTLMVIVTTLALVGDISGLAKATAVLLLCGFMLVNGALVLLKHRPGEPRGKFEVPVIIPICGILVCGALLLNAARKELAIAGGLLGLIMLLYVILRPKSVLSDE